MDKNPLKSGQSKLPKQRGLKNIGFVVLLLLIGWLLFSSYNKSPTLQTLPLSQVIQNANAGEYSKISVSGTVLKITKKGSSTASLQSNMGTYTDLKTDGLNLNKVELQYQAVSSTG